MSSLVVEIRKRMGQTVFDEFHEALIETIARRRAKKSVKAVDDDNDSDASAGKYIYISINVDGATVLVN